MKYFVSGAIALLMSLSVFAQKNDDDANVSLKEVKREFSFVAGNNEFPVNIKEESNFSYFCNSYRTSVTVAEFYNEMESIDAVDILVDGSKKHGIVPKHDFYESDGIFYSDARVCYFSLPLSKQGAESKVKTRKTIRDPKYFTSIHFMEPYPIADQEVVIRVPSWMKIELKEFNLEKYKIKKSVTMEGDNKVYRFTMKNLPALKRESSSPGFTYYSPHIMVLCKYAEPKQGRQTYFNTLKDQYDWYRKLVLEIGNDRSVIKEKAQELTKEAKTDEEKVKLIFQWVQDNIRYIAFEDGIAGFKPEKAQEVLRKKYGDCKGMANLVVELLSSLGLDARRCWIGTRHLAYDYSTPSLAVDNHMIAVWMKDKKPIYLDATEKYIGYGELAERIQGRQTMIEDGANYILDRVPVADARQNTAFEKRKLSIEGSNLKGKVIQSWKGENKVMLLTGINSIKQEKREVVLNRFLSGGKSNYEIKTLEIANLTDYNKDLTVQYDVNWKNVLSDFGGEAYLEIDNRRRFDDFKIDTTKRKLPYWFDFKNHLVFETDLSIPSGRQASTLPAPLKIERPGYKFTGSYTLNGSELNYRCEIAFEKTELNPDQFSQWNKDIEQLKEFYNQQIVLTTRK